MANAPEHPRGTALRVGALVGAAVVLLVSACSRPSGSASCAQTDEALDPRSALHVLPNAPEPRYQGDPPTSGPHLMGAGTTGVVDAPLPKPVQVGILERGDVVVSHPEADLAARDQLAELAGPSVVVAPHATLEDVVATAWTRRLSCSTVDLGAMRDFIDAHAGAGPQMGSG